MTQQVIVPMLSYADGLKALDWLTAAFGFLEKTRWLAPDGSLSHGEIELNGARIMLATPFPNYESILQHRQHCDTAQKLAASPWVTDGILVYVEDIESHYQVAKAAGAKILSGIEEQDFGKLYRVEDFEGHRWMFLEEAKQDDDR